MIAMARRGAEDDECADEEKLSFDFFIQTQYTARCDRWLFLFHERSFLVRFSSRTLRMFSASFAVIAFDFRASLEDSNRKGRKEDPLRSRRKSEWGSDRTGPTALAHHRRPESAR